jgi:peptidoglycan/LPS O-acetylase OafA/YrhL
MKGYRPEIDGLRALAVLAVLFFHAKLGLPGGFVGVGVFFVISGFLITSIILRSINNSKFSSLEFWERRIRRIAPALTATVFATLAIAWFMYLPDDFKQVGAATVAQSVFLSNVFHLKVSGYFAPGAETLPLLHTWSLAVEEQFYILFPLVLLLVAKWRPKWIPRLIVVTFIASLILSVALTPLKPQGSFYLLPTRAWQLLLGSLLAVFPLVGALAPRWVRELVSWCGLVAIGIAVWIYDSNTRTPGSASLLPCLGAAGFMWANRDGLTSAGKLFAVKPLVFVGKISYSLYLVHWPIFVFAFYVFGAQLTWEHRVGLLLLTFLVAVISWLCIETPFRDKKVFGSRKAIFTAAAVSTTALVLFGLAIQKKQGFPSRFDPQVVKYANARHSGVSLEPVSLKSAREADFIELGPNKGDLKYMLWGDSHAMSYMPAMDAQCDKFGVRGCLATYPATPPLLDYVSRYPFSLADNSPEYSKLVVDFAIKNRLQTVVLAALWANYANDPLFEPSLRKTVGAFTSAGIDVVIVLDVASLAEDVPRRLAMSAMLGKDVRKVGVPIERYRERNRVAESIIRKLAGPKVEVLDPAKYFVDETGLWRMEFGGESMYCDAGHLSLQGALRVSPLFETIFIED